MTTSLQIRPCQPADVAAVAAIYAPYVQRSLATFEVEVPSEEELAARRRAVVDRGFPYLVAEDDGGVAGFAYVAPFRDRAAYDRTGEHSVYIHPDRRRAGVGGKLLQALIAASQQRGLSQLIAVIGDSANVASIAFHASHAFVRIGTLRRVGYKFDRYVDVVLMQRQIDAPSVS